MATPEVPRPLRRSAFIRHQGGSDRDLARAVAAGSLERIRRGAYIDQSAWQTMNPEQRHMLRVMATAAAADGDPIFSHESAAIVWGAPIVGPLTKRTHVTVAPGSGLRSNRSVIRHEAEVRAADVEQIAFVRVTGLARTVLDVAATRTFVSGVCAAEYALRAGGIAPHALEAALLRRRPFRGSRAAERVLAFASTRSGSPLESLCRVRFDELGFDQPEQQRIYHGTNGRSYEVDFYWPEWDVIVETDGRVKYEDRRFLGDRSPEEVLWEEKLREDELRAQCRRLERVVWADAWDRAGLIAKLARAGIPRRG